MNKIYNFLLTALLISSTAVFAKGGDDAGNGGFAYKQSIRILKMATDSLEDKIKDSQLKDLVDHPERRTILQDTLSYDNIQKIYLWNLYRDGKKLEMDYVVNPPKVKVAKAYYQAFAGKTDTEVEDASLEVQKRLLHEAAHIWGYNEDAAENFAITFLRDDNGGVGHGNRPTNAIDIKSDYCSCLNGKSDSVNQCDEICAEKPVSSQPILYVNTILGPDITLNPKLGNLYNWCSVQLKGDTTTPQCMLNAFDGTNSLNIPVTVTHGSNSFIVNILALAKDRTWVLKLVESKTGSEAQSKEFQILRKTQKPIPDPDSIGALRVSPISQYTCVTFGGKINGNGDIDRTSYAKNHYYFTANETPPPIPYQGPFANLVCHDDEIHPGPDSAEYERLELIPAALTMWDKSDLRFIAQNGDKLRINKILEDRLADEFNLPGISLNLFNRISFPNRPNDQFSTLGYMMVPFVRADSGKSYCPNSTEYNGNQPLMNLLGEYMDDTEGLYLSETEYNIQDGSTYKHLYGTMFVREETLKSYGFYIEHGLKIKADENTLHTKTIYYYYPISYTTDPLSQGNRKLYTVRSIDTINGNLPSFPSRGEPTSDKRIGCIPKMRGY